MQALFLLLRSVKLNLFAAAEKLHKCICFPSLLEKTEPFIFCCMKRHHIMIILVDHFPSAPGCPFFYEFILKSGQNLYKMLYLSVNCILTKRRIKITTFYLTKYFSGMSLKRIGNGFQDHQSGVSYILT